MKLIVTGASGFIGRNVLLRMPRSCDVTALYHESGGFDAFVRDSNLTHVTPVRCDLTDVASVKALATAIGGPVDAVLYLAANGDPARSAQQPGWDLALNAGAIVNFLDAIVVDHLVFVSSGAVYDGLIGPVSPASPVSPRLPYAISKLASEHYVRAFSERRGTPASYFNVRFFGAYGPHEPARKVTTRWLTAIASGAREFTVRGSGENLIDFMYVDDAVSGLLALLEARGTSATIDFASGSPLTVNALLRRMAGLFSVDVALRHEGRTDEFIEFRSIDRTMHDRFGFSPRVTLEDGLTRLAHIVGGPQHA